MPDVTEEAAAQSIHEVYSVHQLWHLENYYPKTQSHATDSNALGFRHSCSRLMGSLNGTLRKTLTKHLTGKPTLFRDDYLPKSLFATRFTPRGDRLTKDPRLLSRTLVNHVLWRRAPDYFYCCDNAHFPHCWDE